MRCALRATPPTASSSWIMGLLWRRGRHSGSFPRPARRALAPSSPSSDVEIAMEAWSRFLDTFFNLDVIERYFPAIMKGVVVTIEIAAAVVVTGTLLGLVLAIVRTFRLIPMNALIVVFVDMFRALPPLVLVLLVYFGLPNIGINLPSFAVLWLVLALVTGRLRRGDFLGRHSVDPEGSMGGGTFHGLRLSRHARLCRAATGDPLDCAAAHQPHDRHHQEHRAWHGDRSR